MRAADRVVGLDTKFGFERREEGVEIGQAEGVGLMDDTGQFRIDQRGEHDGSHAVGFTLGVDAGDGLLGFFDVIEEGNANLLEFDILELGHQTVAEGLDREAGAVGHEEDGAFD